MKAIPLKLEGGELVQCEPSEATYLRMKYPNRGDRFEQMLCLPVQIKGRREGTGNWTWNGDTDKPTLRPSVLQTMPPTTDQCHVWITDGQVIFLSDCTHELAGQTLDLLDVE